MLTGIKLSITALNINKEYALNVLTLLQTVLLLIKANNIHVITHILVWATIVELDIISGTFLMIQPKHVILRFYSARNKKKKFAINVVMDTQLLIKE